MQRPLRSIDPPSSGGALAPTLAPVAPVPPVGPPAAGGLVPPALRDVLRIDSQRLFAGTAEVQIEHNGVTYRLKQTSSGKLILTK